MENLDQCFREKLEPFHLVPNFVKFETSKSSFVDPEGFERQFFSFTGNATLSLKYTGTNEAFVYPHDIFVDVSGAQVRMYDPNGQVLCNVCSEKLFHVLIHQSNCLCRYFCKVRIASNCERLPEKAVASAVVKYTLATARQRQAKPLVLALPITRRRCGPCSQRNPKRAKRRAKLSDRLVNESYLKPKLCIGRGYFCSDRIADNIKVILLWSLFLNHAYASTFSLLLPALAGREWSK